MDRQVKLIVALRQAAEEIKSSAKYEWGHMGSCNCGYLAQKLTGQSRSQIHKNAMEKNGDWSEQLNDYCPNSGYPMDNLIFDLLQNGLSVENLASLERLSDSKVLDTIHNKHKPLRYNVANDVSIYMNAWATLLEEELMRSVSIDDLNSVIIDKKLPLAYIR